RLATASRTYWLGLAVSVPAVSIGVYAYFLRGQAAAESGDQRTVTVLIVTAIVCGVILIGGATVLIGIVALSRRRTRRAFDRLIAESPESMVVMVGGARTANGSMRALRSTNALVLGATHLHLVRAGRKTQMLRS